MKLSKLLAVGGALLWSLFLAAPVAHAAPILVTIDTSARSGLSAQLALDLIDGGAPANTVTVSNFSSDATLGAASALGDVTGALPGVLTFADTSFFNEYLQFLTLGGTISFVIDTTGNAPDAFSFPDGFSLFLLDPLTGLPLGTTTDPTGANALFLLDIGTSTGLTLYASDLFTVTAVPFVATVAEPNGFWLVVSALSLLIAAVLYQRRRFASRGSPTDLTFGKTL